MPEENLVVEEPVEEITSQEEVKPVEEKPVIEDKKAETSEEKPEGDETIVRVTPEWAQKRISKLVFEREEAKKLAGEIRAENERLKSAPKVEGAPAGDPSKFTEAEIDRRARIKADSDRRAEKFNEACNKTYDAGKAKFKDFDVAIANLNAVGALGENVDSTFLETVNELDDAAMIIHHLGNNPEEAAKIVSLAPKKMAIELARLESTLKKPSKEISQAPPPITPVGGKAKSEINPDADDVPMDKWLEWRNKQLERRRSGR